MCLHASLHVSLSPSVHRSSVTVLDLSSNMSHELTLPVEVKQLLVVSPQQWIVEDTAR